MGFRSLKTNFVTSASIFDLISAVYFFETTVIELSARKKYSSGFCCMALKSALLALTLFGVSNGIYPDDHWNYAKELTTDNFKEHVLNEIEAGRTLFVRWIASPA